MHLANADMSIAWLPYTFPYKDKQQIIHFFKVISEDYSYNYLQEQKRLFSSVDI